MKSCFKLPEFVLDTVVMNKICKYHKRKGQAYRPNDIIRDFCSDAFYVSYPSCLALLYDADKNEFKNGKLCLSCPNPDGIEFEIRRIHCYPLYIRITKKVFEWLIAKLLYPLDWEDWNIRIKVTKNKGGCPVNFNIGRTYLFNIRRLDELCPASFYGIYPILLSHLLEHNLSWQTQKDMADVHCPDHNGIVYRVRRKEEVNVDR